MLANDPRETRRDRRARTRHRLGSPERLEARELLAYSPLGFSLPDLTVSGFAAPVAAYGGPLGLTIDVSNLGASSIVEPLNLEPGATSTADAPPSEVEVFISPRHRLGAGAIRVATIDVPAVRQNSLVRIDTTITLPATQPSGFPGSGGSFFVFLRIDPDRLVQDNDRTNNITRAGIAVQVAAPLPDLEAIALDVPPSLQPGDAILPTIRVANFGTTDTAPQGPVTVLLVASTDANFGPGDEILATYEIANLPPLAAVPMENLILGDVNIDEPINVATLTGPVIFLPDGPDVYNIGVIVDPLNTIREISETGAAPSSALDPIRQVGPPLADLPPAGVIGDAPTPPNEFPVPPLGPINAVGAQPLPTTDTDPVDTNAAFSAAVARRLAAFARASNRNRLGRRGGRSRPPKPPAD